MNDYSLSTSFVNTAHTVKVPPSFAPKSGVPSKATPGPKRAPTAAAIQKRVQFSPSTKGMRATSKLWNERAINYLNGVENKIEACLPNSIYQDKLDKVGNYIESKFDCLDKFNKWLDSNGEGEWYKKLAVFLYKLPMRVVRNIVRLLYNIVKMALYTVVHPIKASVKLAKLLVNLAKALTIPSTWSKIGAGVFGASIGAATGTGCSVSLIGTGLGLAMMLGGMTYGALKSALEAKKGEGFNAAQQELFSHVREIPEAMLTGFVTGLIMGAIQKAVFTRSMHQWADKFVEQNKLPPADKLWYDSKTNEICFAWKNYSQVTQIMKKMPGWGFWKAPDCWYVKITPTPMAQLTLPIEVLKGGSATGNAALFGPTATLKV